MDERFEVELTKAEYVVGLQALTGELARNDPFARRRTYERLAATVLLILAITYLQPDAVMGIFILIVSYSLIEMLLVRRWTDSAHGVSFDPAIGPVALHFTDDGIAETSAIRTRHWSWNAVRKIHDRDSAAVFELAGWDMVVLPNRLWPDPASRERFLTAALQRLPDQSDQALSRAYLPQVMTADLFNLATIAAFVDACLVLTLVMPPYIRPLADLGTAAVMVLVMLVAILLGYAAYRAAQSGLPHLHARSPLAAKIVAHALIWAFAVWFAGASLELF